MSDPLAAVAIKDLSTVLTDFREEYTRHGKDWSVAEQSIRARLSARGLAALDRWAIGTPTYREFIDSVIRNNPWNTADKLWLELIKGNLQAVLADYESGTIRNPRALVQAATFADFLDMADALFDAHYTDQALVTAVGTLEQHLRRMCEYFNVELPKRKDQRAADAAVVNDHLAKAKRYRRGSDHDHIAAWLKERNVPAHGKYAEIPPDQVRRTLDGIRAFVNLHSLSGSP